MSFLTTLAYDGRHQVTPRLARVDIKRLAELVADVRRMERGPRSLENSARPIALRLRNQD